jgi:hypothetical protein
LLGAGAFDETAFDRQEAKINEPGADMTKNCPRWSEAPSGLDARGAAPLRRASAPTPTSQPNRKILNKTMAYKAPVSPALLRLPRLRVDSSY